MSTHEIETTPDVAEPEPKAKQPLYPRLLRLRHIHPNAWQRALLGEGALALALLLVLADLATAWALLVLPLAVAAVVKAHDLLAGRLETERTSAVPPGS
ncbi:MAG: Collagen alpha-5(VI) chain [Frankiales bacterium]|jgi:hypothetical protein|nr:Collagen alpha-5(VI) chain [Frankiales bacterium]